MHQTNTKHFFLQAAMTLLLTMLTSLSAWAQFASTSDGWIIQKSSDGTRCLLKGYEYYADMVKVYPAIIDGAAVVTITDKNLEPKGFPNIDTLYLYNDYEYNEMPLATGCANLKKIVLVDRGGAVVGEDSIPEGITTIPDSAFYGCKALQNIRISNNVKSIGESAFEKCSSLESITLPNSLESIGESAFYGCNSLQNIRISNNVKSKGEGAFELCKSLKSINIPNSVTIINKCTFRDCSSLKSITLPNSLESIGGSAFESCISLDSITLPNSLKSISEWAFARCSSLESINIPNSVTIINKYAFFNCFSLDSITIPNSVTVIDGAAFGLCYSLTATIMGNPWIHSDAFPDEATVMLNLPSKVEIQESQYLSGPEYWTTFCNSSATFKADDETMVYKAKVIDDRLALIEVKDKIVDASTTVLLSRKEESNFVLTKTNTPSTDTHDSELTGTDAELQMIENKLYDYLYDYWHDITLLAEPSEAGTVTTSGILTTSGIIIGKEGDKVSLKATANEGYVFVGWSSSGLQIANPMKAETTFIMPKKDVTVKAVFYEYNTIPEGTYKVTLNNNDGDPYGMAQIMSGSNTYTLPARTRTGYVFLGWATSADAPINNLDAGLRAGCEITPTANLTLYGAWLPSPVQMADDADNSDVIAALNGLGNVNVKLQGRTLYKDGKWNTICLPFGLTLEAGTVARSLTSASITDNETAGQTLHLTFSDAVTELQAGVPYIIKWDEGDDITNPEFTNVTVISDAPQSQSFTNNGTKVSFVGTYSPKELTANTTANLYMGSNNKLLYPTQEGFKVNAFRAYFEIETNDAEAKQFSNIVLDFGEEEATGISSVSEKSELSDNSDSSDYSDNSNHSSAYFTLDGIRLNGKPTEKGIYIHNGKKVIK